MKNLNKNLLPSTSLLLKKYNLFPKKSFGQNFILDDNINDKIVKFAGDIKDKTIIEVGPGPGGLSRAILRAGAKKLIAIEKDRRFVPLLEEIKQYYQDNFLIINQDALETNYAELFDGRISIIANLPYNIATALIFKWIMQYRKIIDSLTITIQKEVAQRINAKVKTAQYGRMSVMLQLLCEIEKNFDLTPQCFFPPPKVTSTVICLKPKQNINENIDIEKIADLCKILFNQRRKMIKSAKIDNWQEKLNRANIDGNLRPQDLTVNDFIKLQNC